MRLKRIVLLLVLSFLLCKTNLLCGQFNVLENIGDKFCVLIEILGEDEKKTGLTEKRLRTVTELRLRREGMKVVTEVTRKTPFIYVNVSVVGPVYDIALEIHEWVELERIPITHGTIATTWNKAFYGGHERDPERIVSGLDQLFDAFFNDYYKANPKEKEARE